MPPRKGPPPPIDRPLSRAYLREFVGWSTAYPPGQSEPNSLRLMENVNVDRNGALQVRYGLRYLTYTETPGLDPEQPDAPGTSLGLEVIGSPELFYQNDGSPALLFAVRETGPTLMKDRVGFRVALFNQVEHVVHTIDDPEVGFLVPQGFDILNFNKGTTHVEYLQINNRILALSNNGEPARMFFVGGQKMAKRLKAISVPDWNDAHKLTAFHPDAGWINGRTSTTRINTVLNPSFEIGTRFWTKSAATRWKTVEDPGVQGSMVLEVESAPTRTNMVPIPLHEESSPWFTGWLPGVGNPTLSANNGYLQISPQNDQEFLANGPRIIDSVVSDGKYQVALDIQADGGAKPIIVLESFAANGMPLGSRVVDIDITQGRWVSPALDASTGAVSLQLHLGGRGTPEQASVQFRNLVVCPNGEPTDMFHGGSGVDYYWTGAEDKSASVYHPPRDITVQTNPYAIIKGPNPVAGSISLKKMQAADSTANVSVLVYTSNYTNPNKEGTSVEPTADVAVGTDWARFGALRSPVVGGYVSSALQVIFYAAKRGERFRMGAGMMETAASYTLPYFDGSTPSDADTVHKWYGVFSNLPHEGPSQEIQYGGTGTMGPETPTEKTLFAAKTGETVAKMNPYKIAFFYTFENEIGESAGSRITEQRISRPWSNWVWETPNAAGEPSGTYTPTPEAVADQLVVQLPQSVYDTAVLEGALRWNLYAFAWSDQEPVPVVAQLVATQDINPDQSEGAAPLPYEIAGWIRVTPSRRATTDDTVLPTQENRVNSSIPPQHRNGLVAGDRMVLVGSPSQPATISWSSSAPGRYTMFTPNRGGGQKTLTSGNLNLPYSVVLWQNPQSIDTLTILCSDDNGRSTSYYMQPASLQAGNTGLASIMGFEETTSTPGTVAPFGAEVLNNALYRPLDRFLLKSTASNYNINHKTQTDKIANMWRLLESRQWIMSGQLDNRLFYLVHNPRGELLIPGCKGNEIWVYDVAAENGHWARFLVQGSALKPITIGAQSYMSVSCPDGVYYFDESYLKDDYTDYQGLVRQRPIPWMFETNTQGANRAHDAWAHLQQVGVVLGNFRGSLKYGVRGWSLNGKRVDISKIATDKDEPPPPEQKWDIEDVLLIRRDMKEWYFYASSLEGVPGTGQIGVVQYRYTPVSVNVGYEFGSIETFEYGADAGSNGTAYSRNGIPQTYLDYARP